MVGPALIFEVVGPNRDDVLDTAMLPDEPGAGQRPAVGTDAAQHHVAAVQLLAERFQPRPGLRLQAAIGQLLDAVGRAG